MIEEFFSKQSNLIVLENGILKKGNQYEQIPKIYLFMKTKTLKVEELGNEWITDHVRVEQSFKGYFYSAPQPLSFEKLLDIDSIDEENLTLIANRGTNQYKINDVSVNKSKGIISRFTALSVDIIHK